MSRINHLVIPVPTLKERARVSGADRAREHERLMGTWSLITGQDRSDIRLLWAALESSSGEMLRSRRLLGYAIAGHIPNVRGTSDWGWPVLAEWGVRCFGLALPDRDGVCGEMRIEGPVVYGPGDDDYDLAVSVYEFLTQWEPGPESAERIALHSAT